MASLYIGVCLSSLLAYVLTYKIKIFWIITSKWIIFFSNVINVRRWKCVKIFFINFPRTNTINK